MTTTEITGQFSSADISTELSSRRTGMSFQRTRMSADRTLMSVIRTALSLISFGFTIYQVFAKLRDAGALLPGGSAAPRDFGLSLVALGTVLLVFGIWHHIQFMLELRAQRRRMAANGLVHAESDFPISTTLIIAVLLVLLGIFAFVSSVFDILPFQR